MSALSHGLPLVIIPLGADQPLAAQRATELGVGVGVVGREPLGSIFGPCADPDRLNAESVRTAVRQVLADPSFRDNARRLREEIEAMPGSEEAAALIERYIAEFHNGRRARLGDRCFIVGSYRLTCGLPPLIRPDSLNP